MKFFLDPIVSRLIDKLVGLVNEELDLILGVPEEIRKLRNTLHLIQTVLNDAQQQQITQQTVKHWLSNLNDVMYDADDILDEYWIMAEEWASREHPPEEPSIGCRMLPLFGCFRQVKFTHEIGSKIRDLNQRLEQIWTMKSNLNLTESDRRREEVIRVHRQTSSGVEPDIVGEAIEKDTRELVDLLLRKDEGANTKPVVFAIVGIGGIGKTTLAQKIFNDDKIKNVFKMIWMCVSQEVVGTDLLKEIITSVGGSPGEARSKEQLESKVKDVLKDSKFMLVLDDVWDAKIWEDWLRKPLQVGAVGSRVLITTRNKGVAERMKADHIHRVEALSLVDSWLLLLKKVTKNAEEERDVESLKDIGMRIVEKCQGLPLAITTIGGVLCEKLSKWEWERVECNSAWSQEGLPEGVHQALYLSYEDLPSHLKQCFLHCSLFREDSLLDREDLVQLWVAEGFVVKVEGEEYPLLEEIAQGYLDELIQRSLLQVYEDERIFRPWYYCKIHDLLRSLCHFLARDESSVIRDIYKHTAKNDSIKLRRLSVVAPKSEDIKQILRSIQCNQSVRTLLLVSLILDDKDAEDCFNNFQRLRVVHFGMTMIQSLPQSVRNLLHLKYLNLTNCLELKELPESIASLKNLQFLILEACTNLKTLPKGVVQLRNLRTLNLVLVPLEELPSGIASLEHLNVLKGAVVSSFSSHSNNNNTSSSSSSSCALEEICQLQKLRELSIVLKTSARCNPDVNGLNRSLTALKYLLDLELSCTTDKFDRHDINDPIFDGALHPPSCVRKLLIEDFFSLQFPQWLMSNSISSLLTNLTKLKLINCLCCSLLPPLGKLPNLEFLVLHSLHAVKRIGADFFGYEEGSISDGLGCESGGSRSTPSSQTLFPRLKRLRLAFLYNLEAWHWVPKNGGTVAMPRLNELQVLCCPKLLSLPEGLNRQAIPLTLLVRQSNLNFTSVFPCVKYMRIHGTNSNYPNIVSDLPALEALEVLLEENISLSLPDWLLQGLPHLTSLHKLKLTCSNKQLLYSCLQDGPDWPKLKHIPIVQINDDQGNYISYIKHSSTFQTNLI